MTKMNKERLQRAIDKKQDINSVLMLVRIILLRKTETDPRNSDNYSNCTNKTKGKDSNIGSCLRTLPRQVIW